MHKNQRIRDPLHNIISFEADEFENVMWSIVQSRPFQRLRRIKQLGFSDVVYPGATHSRFSHSIGVFHTARRLMNIIERHLRANSNWKPSKAKVALAASLVHDVGHGPFSHAFEEVGKRLGLEMANHEAVSDRLIRESEISEELNRLGGGFASDVADVIKGDGESTLYSAVVSSQFDADRLDYMRRDRMMAGSSHGVIDFNWLLDNIEVGEVRTGIDDILIGEVETFVLGPKALYAAEAYVIGLFHLYPAIYLHKTTRGAEKIFTELMCRVFELAKNGSASKTGISKHHPLCQFANRPSDLNTAQALDDAVVWGSLSQLSDAADPLISDLSTRLRDRKLYKVIDVREEIRKALGGKDAGDTALELNKLVEKAKLKIDEWISKNSKDDSACRILFDTYERSPYKRLDPSKGPINQIMIRNSTGELVDLKDLSPAVSAIEPFRLFRVYLKEDDDKAREFIDSIIRGAKNE